MEFLDDDPFNLPPAPKDHHGKFRARKVWKDFRGEMIRAKGYRCELCNGHYKGVRASKLQVHHLHPEQYEDLDPGKFRVLCTSCHNDFVEIWVTRLNGSKWEPGPYFLALYRVLRDFLPYSTLDRAREWARKLEGGG